VKVVMMMMMMNWYALDEMRLTVTSINVKVHEKFDMEYKNRANLLCQMVTYL